MYRISYDSAAMIYIWIYGNGSCNSHRYYYTMLCLPCHMHDGMCDEHYSWAPPTLLHRQCKLSFSVMWFTLALIRSRPNMKLLIILLLTSATLSAPHRRGKDRIILHGIAILYWIGAHTYIVMANWHHVHVLLVYYSDVVRYKPSMFWQLSAGYSVTLHRVLPCMLCYC